jgi:hypothetical protein
MAACIGGARRVSMRPEAELAASSTGGTSIFGANRMMACRSSDTAMAMRSDRGERSVDRSGGGREEGACGGIGFILPGGPAWREI